MTAELLDTAEHPPPAGEFATLYAQAQVFYAHQMRLLDTHDTGRWAETFTENALLHLPSPSGPLRARAALESYVRAGAVRRRQAGGRLDHWVGMLDVRPQTDGSLHTRCSALAYLTPGHGGPKALHVYAMEDVLVRRAGRWHIAHRRITRDDLA
ncbi:nuclear transport factor 2 family protein [Streptomyces sp. NPDC002667]|uniref:nuclear transport factor 2 family protein n=1 Tax=Streptomyces sp. NPDC002667 TaxID=3364657 RepID=UPI003682CC2F